VRAGALFLILAAVAFPIGLAFAVYVTAAPSLAATPVPAAITERAIAEPSPRTTTTEQTTTDDRGSDRCLEPEHRLDPECVSGSGSDSDDGDSSGSGSSGSDSSGSDNSGSGSGSSGSGSSGSSGSGSSGSGGGDD
jgi:hypothetical protein